MLTTPANSQSDDNIIKHQDDLIIWNRPTIGERLDTIYDDRLLAEIRQKRAENEAWRLELEKTSTEQEKIMETSARYEEFKKISAKHKTLTLDMERMRAERETVSPDQKDVDETNANFQYSRTLKDIQELLSGPLGGSYITDESINIAFRRSYHSDTLEWLSSQFSDKITSQSIDAALSNVYHPDMTVFLLTTFADKVTTESINSVLMEKPKIEIVELICDKFRDKISNDSKIYLNEFYVDSSNIEECLKVSGNVDKASD